MSNIYGKYFEQLGGLGLNLRPFLTYQLTLITQKPIKRVTLGD